MYSELGHQIRIYTTEVPKWISESSNLDSKVALDLWPNMSNYFLGTILCFKDCKSNSIAYSVKNTTSNFIWSDKSYNACHTSLMVIVPRSIFSVMDGDNRIEVSADAEIHGIHIQYTTSTITPLPIQQKLPFKTVETSGKCREMVGL
nr:resistance protein RPS4-like protein [Anethum foeniculum]WJK71389.1 leaf rust 10 disease-resistance locus receptor-like protein kinase-like 2.1 [Anethum foeniculum]